RALQRRPADATTHRSRWPSNFSRHWMTCRRRTEDGHDVVSPSPRARESVTGLSRRVAQRSVDVCVALELSSTQPQQVRQAIDVRDDRGLYGSARLLQSDDRAFGPATYGASQIELRRRAMLARQRPVEQNAVDGL